MRTSVYRNLDAPFQILGFNVFELTLLSVLLVLSNELLTLLSLSRLWAFMVIFLYGLCVFWLRHSLGHFFLRRLIRFYQLPSRLHRRLMNGKFHYDS